MTARRPAESQELCKPLMPSFPLPPIHPTHPDRVSVYGWLKVSSTIGNVLLPEGQLNTIRYDTLTLRVQLTGLRPASCFVCIDGKNELNED